MFLRKIRSALILLIGGIIEFSTFQIAYATPENDEGDKPPLTARYPALHDFVKKLEEQEFSFEAQKKFKEAIDNPTLSETVKTQQFQLLLDLIKDEVKFAKISSMDAKRLSYRAVRKALEGAQTSRPLLTAYVRMIGDMTGEENLFPEDGDVKRNLLEYLAFLADSNNEIAHFLCVRFVIHYANKNEETFQDEVAKRIRMYGLCLSPFDRVIKFSKWNNFEQKLHTYPHFAALAYYAVTFWQATAPIVNFVEEQANQGIKEAQACLGRLYRCGEGGKQKDLKQAFKWYNHASGKEGEEEFTLENIVKELIAEVYATNPLPGRTLQLYLPHHDALYSRIKLIEKCHLRLAKRYDSPVATKGVPALANRFNAMWELETSILTTLEQMKDENSEGLIKGGFAYEHLPLEETDIEDDVYIAVANINGRLFIAKGYKGRTLLAALSSIFQSPQFTAIPQFKKDDQKLLTSYLKKATRLQEMNDQADALADEKQVAAYNNLIQLKAQHIQNWEYLETVPQKLMDLLLVRSALNNLIWK